LREKGNVTNRIRKITHDCVRRKREEASPLSQNKGKGRLAEHRKTLGDPKGKTGLLQWEKGGYSCYSAISTLVAVGLPAGKRTTKRGRCIIHKKLEMGGLKWKGKSMGGEKTFKQSGKPATAN